MALAVIMPPVSIVSIDQAKAHLRVSGSNLDDVVQDCIDAAQASIDGPAGWLGRSVGDQVLELQGLDAAAWRDLCAWSGPIALPCPPVASIVSVMYGAGVTLDPATYAAGPDGTLRPSPGGTWPWLASDLPSVRIRFRAGYAAAGGSVPAPVVAALKLMIQDLFLLGSRDPSLTADTVFGVQARQYAMTRSPALGQTAEALLMPFRVA